MNPAAKGIAIGSARLSMLVVAIAIISAPWIAGWTLSTFVIWNASFVTIFYAVNLLLLRTAARWDIRQQISQGEQVRLVVAVRRMVGRLPFSLLGDEFVVAFTDQRLLIQRRSTFTGRPRGALHLGEQVTFLQGKVLSIETESGVRIDALVQMAHRRDVAYWIRRWQDR
ncbi:hypothetical protein [Streptomyces flaveus]|uniref:Uncharacterized protein n=1 Tax=Streptomyces flaveus TaxID=66370 RepID=A0A917QDM3_9ACTN|nr:hypothetical protein [Streptomyces flaveus]GGK45393.1 hypothetical protein GCM10010094_01400 [Streptomyces flaveus]